MNAQQTRTKFRLPATPLHPLPVPKHIAIHNRTCVTFRKGWVSNNPLHGFVVTSEFQHCHICKILKSLKCMRVSGNKKMRAATSTAFIHLSTSQIDPRDGSGRVAYGRIGLRREFVCLLRVRFVIFFNCVRVDVFFLSGLNRVIYIVEGNRKSAWSTLRLERVGFEKIDPWTTMGIYFQINLVGSRLGSEHRIRVFFVAC